MSLIKSLIPSSIYSIKSPYTMNPIGICIHNTANDAPAINEINYMKSNTNKVSFHVAIDDKEAIQAIEFNRSAYHAGDGATGTGNRNYISIEICYSKSGGTRFIEAEKRAAKEVAAILKSYNWGIDKVKAHRDFSGKDCPHRTNMANFKTMINAELDKLVVPTTQTNVYRIFKDGTQQGTAYANVENIVALVRDCLISNPPGRIEIIKK